MKGGIGLWRNIIDGDRVLLIVNSICCVYKQKIVKTTHTNLISFQTNPSDISTYNH